MLRELFLLARPLVLFAWLQVFGVVVSLMSYAVGSSFEDLTAQATLITFVHSSDMVFQLRFDFAAERAAVTKELYASSSMYRL